MAHSFDVDTDRPGCGHPAYISGFVRYRPMDAAARPGRPVVIFHQFANLNAALGGGYFQSPPGMPAEVDYPVPGFVIMNFGRHRENDGKEGLIAECGLRNADLEGGGQKTEVGSGPSASSGGTKWDPSSSDTAGLCRG